MPAAICACQSAALSIDDASVGQLIASMVLSMNDLILVCLGVPPS